MSSDLYLGLTTLEAGVFAIFAASIFVLIETGTDLFTPVTPYFLIRRRMAQFSVGLSSLILLVGLAVSIRTAFPDTDVRVGNWHTDFLVNEAWPGFVYGIAIAISVPINFLVFVQLMSDFRGPGVVSALVQQAQNEGIKDWLDFVEPPEPETPPALWAIITRVAEEKREKEETKLSDEDAERARHKRNKELRERLTQIRKRQERGELADPLGPLFEVAARSIEARRYSVVERSLFGVRTLTNEWLSGRSSPAREDASRLFNSLRRHFNDLLEVAVAAGSHSQIDVMVRTCEGMAIDAIGWNAPFGYPALFADELVNWAKRLDASAFRPLIVSIIESIERCGAEALEKGDVDTFRQCLLKLGQIGEVLGQRYEPEVGIHILERNIGSQHAKSPDDALVESVYRLIRRFADERDGIKGNVVFICDTLYICTRSYLSARDFDQRAAEYARHFVSGLGDLAILAAKMLDGDALWSTIHNMRELSEDPRFLATEMLDKSLAWSAFEVGMVTQANEEKLVYHSGPFDTDLTERLVEICSRCSEQALQDAVSGLYDRGHTMYIDQIDPDAQRLFLKRLEAATGWDLRHY